MGLTCGDGPDWNCQRATPASKLVAAGRSVGARSWTQLGAVPGRHVWRGWRWLDVAADASVDPGPPAAPPSETGTVPTYCPLSAQPTHLEPPRATYASRRLTRSTAETHHHPRPPMPGALKRMVSGSSPLAGAAKGPLTRRFPAESSRATASPKGSKLLTWGNIPGQGPSSWEARPGCPFTARKRGRLVPANPRRTPLAPLTRRFPAESSRATASPKGSKLLT